ncbi:MAG: LD-carboxypeptidase [Nitrospira sp.]|nr:LD-carboxypeptidase [Candidatus Manganitrophaceae bacterium]HIL35414.1 LD-carboxypeptidase [Candidatus Manganitrophaceae bacterium]
MHSLSLKKPPRLSPGGTIGIVAPAGWVESDLLQKGIARLEHLGFHVIPGKNVTRRQRYFAGTDLDRAGDFQAMALNKKVDAIFCARGGVGTARMIPHLDRNILAGSQKIVVGSSDITTLLLYLTHSLGWVTFHGPMAATHFGREASPALETHLFEILSGKTAEMKFPDLQTLKSGTAEGILTGGCLTLLCTTIGTPFEIETDDRLLFIEDINEAPYRIDRMLSYLKLLGKFDRVRGVIFGEMPGCNPKNLPEIILDILGDFQCPMLLGFPSGHGLGIATLPLGIPMQLNADTGTLRMLEPAVS